MANPTRFLVWKMRWVMSHDPAEHERWRASLSLKWVCVYCREFGRFWRQKMSRQECQVAARKAVEKQKSGA